MGGRTRIRGKTAVGGGDVSRGASSTTSVCGDRESKVCAVRPCCGLAEGTSITEPVSLIGSQATEKREVL